MGFKYCIFYLIDLMNKNAIWFEKIIFLLISSIQSISWYYVYGW